MRFRHPFGIASRTIQLSRIARVSGITLLLVVSLLAGGANARAQCPDGSWSGPASWGVQIPGTSCFVTTYYCWKNNPDGSISFIITAIVAPNTSPCSTLTPQQIVSGAISGFWVNPPVPVGVVIQPCGQGPTIVYAFTTSPCWHENSSGLPIEYGNNPYQNSTTFLSCGDGSCVTSCQYCQVGGHIVEVSCSTQLGLSGNCAEPPTDGPILMDVCYDLNPCHVN